MGHAELEPEDIDPTISPFHGALKRTWISFCATTSIHGLKYTKDEETHRIARYIWVVISLVMFLCAIAMVYTFYLDYRSNPTRMNVENDHAPITSIYLPAITICPEVQFNVDRSRRYLSTLTLPRNFSMDQAIDSLGTVTGFFNDDNEFETEQLEFMEELLVTNKLNMNYFAKRTRWSCDDIMVRCRLYGRVTDCNKLFHLSLTFQGYCCSFNLQQPGLNFTAKLARPSLRGGLSLILAYKDTDYRKLLSYSYGFNLLITEHAAFPSAHANMKFLPINDEVFVAVRPTETFCSQSVKDLSFDARQCLFPDEQPLRYFPSYVSANCELDCRASNMIKFCNCLGFFFQFNRTNDRVCTFKDIPCLLDNFAKIVGRYKDTQCPCPEPCESFNYDVQLSSARLQPEIPTVDVFYDGIKDGHAVAHIFMNSQVYRRIRHDLLSNTVTLVSNLGSAFSLFIGMSMVSTVEIFYHFTVILHKFYKQEVKARQKMLFRKSSLVKALAEK